ncbi:hypothetical protein [Streptomyces sp. Ag109_O5-1]|uniref:hypothetical protein n=1 Tax=Streptomyces sp. Ag109_O5-1 TaxID=1938851 RepID=UPI0021A80F46|nr:hypothetical protein [Streptomyces sp. Ag109_O5-1]
MLYRVREFFPDAPSALAPAREISRELADWVSMATPRMEPVTTAERYAYALSASTPPASTGTRQSPASAPAWTNFGAAPS